MGAALQVVRDEAQAGMLLNPTRRKMLELLVEPDSATGVGKQMGLPRQQVSYHLRELERHGLVELVEERRKGNCLERVVRATARTYLISPEALGRLGADPLTVQDRFSASYLLATAGRVIRELAGLVEGARAAGKRLATLTLETEVRFATAADRSAFAEELAQTLARLAARYHRPDAEGGRTFRFVVGAYPAVAGTERNGEEEQDG